MLTSPGKTDRLDHDQLRAAIRRMEDRRPFEPRPHTDIEYYAPCLKTRSEPKGRKLTDDEAKEVYVHYHTGKATQRRLAKLYDVSPNTIHHIVTGKHYREASAS